MANSYRYAMLMEQANKKAIEKLKKIIFEKKEIDKEDVMKILRILERPEKEDD